MKEIREHVMKMFKDIPNSEERNILIEDIISDFNDKVNDLINNGYAESDAINKTISDFGDIEDIKKEFDLVNINKKSNSINQLIFSVVGSVLIIGLLVYINIFLFNNHIWFIYLAFIVLWWPLIMLLKLLNSK